MLIKIEYLHSNWDYPCTKSVWDRITSLGAKKDRKLKIMTWEEIIISLPIYALMRYYLPILINFGIIGNCLLIRVLLGSELRKRSSSVYLAAFAIYDNAFLVTMLVVSMGYIGYMWSDQPGVCQLIGYSSRLFRFSAAWLVTAFTVERFMALRYPTHREFLCSVVRWEKNSI